MATAVLNLTPQHEEASFIDHLCQKRLVSVKVFSHAGFNGHDFIHTVQLQRLSHASLKALKRI